VDGDFPFLRVLQENQRADERTRTSDLISLRVICQGLQGFAEACKCRIFRGVSFLRFAVRCTVLRSRWYQSGIKDALFLVVCGDLRATQSTFLHLAQIVHLNAQARGA
jgi:hypothetical protein